MADTGKPASGRPWLRMQAIGLVERVESRRMTLTVAAAEAIVADRVASSSPESPRVELRRRAISTHPRGLTRTPRRSSHFAPRPVSWMIQPR